MSQSSAYLLLLEDFIQNHLPYVPEDASLEEVPDSLKGRCNHLMGSQYSEELLLLLNHSNTSRKVDEGTGALGHLRNHLDRAPAILEDFGNCCNLEPKLKEKLVKYYVQKWNKCTRRACFYFMEDSKRFPIEKNTLNTTTNRSAAPRPAVLGQDMATASTRN
ncbi:hypothetical protein NHQ30_007577 [Ciborinia camelliae]|nr:hypothetical protein NHQ30_007577 [Ciborinia camelliae]